MLTDNLRVSDISRPLRSVDELDDCGSGAGTFTYTNAEPDHETSKEVTSNLLAPYIGPCLMLDLSRQQGKELTADDLMQACAFIEAESDEGFLLERVLLKTGYDGSSSDYSYLSPDAMLLLRSRSVLLVGIDSPQIDAPGQKSNEVFMRHNKISWIANLNLESTRSDRQYLLAALPLLHRRDSVVPIRAVLIDPTEAD